MVKKKDTHDDQQPGKNVDAEGKPQENAPQEVRNMTKAPKEEVSKDTDKTDNKPKKKFSFKIILCIKFIIIIIALVLAYEFNVYDMQININEYYKTYIQPTLTSVKGKLTLSEDDHEILENVPYAPSDDLADVETQEIDIDNSELEQVSENEASDTELQDQGLEDDQEMMDNDNAHKEAVQNNTEKMVPKYKLEQLLKDVSKYHHYVKEEILSIMQQMLALEEKIHAGEPYSDELRDLIGIIYSDEVELPALFEYADAGFPTDTIIAKDFTHILKQLALIESRSETDSIFMNILSKFVIITPKSHIAGLTVPLQRIYKALYNSHFDLIPAMIDILPENQQAALEPLRQHIARKQALHNELKQLNYTLIQEIFNTPLKANSAN